LKDLIDTAGVRTTAASAVFENRVPARDAAVVRNLKTAGAVLIGKQNLHEFAYGGSSLISHFGPVRNPVNPEHIAGGSSGGSAAAVASGMCLAAVGTDTAGSVREPASLCGIVGLKPSYGLVSTEGVIPLSKSLDHVGPLTRSVADLAIMLDALTGNSDRYHAGLREQRRSFVIGVPRAYFSDDLDSEVADSVEKAIAMLTAAGFTVVDVEVRVDEDRTVQSWEAYAFHRDNVAKHPDLYDPETKRRILSGSNIAEDRYYAAVRELAHMREEIKKIFQTVDVLVTATTPIAAPKIADLTETRDRLRPAELLLLRNTRPVNVWGLPAISVPCGFHSSGLPIGLQIIGPRNGETTVLQVASAFEQLRA
jgi:Asp-tRNA(Asn)/Glu-tRNA(Gln) amidotransferase A subunit family amidase